MRVRGCSQALSQFRICFNGDDAAAFAREKLRHFAVAGADFDPRVIRGERQSREDAFAPSNIAEKMLAQPLSRHCDAECSNAERCEQISMLELQRAQ